MCRSAHPRNAMFCILPPHVLRSIAERGSAAEREAASRTLAVDLTFRSLRFGGPLRAAHARPSVPIAYRQRRVFDARGSQELPGMPVRAEGEPPVKDAAVNEAFDGLGATYDFFFDIYERNSLDDEGVPLDATVHFGRRYDNAFWNGQQMVFGDGDGELFNRFTSALDVIGHELSHGVTEDEAQLAYLFQPGALNESLSDVFGSLVRQYELHQTAEEADWLIGRGLFTAAVNGAALRSMKAPGTAYDDPVLGRDPQPAHMKDFVRTYDDNGGVHINSGIPNRARHRRIRVGQSGADLVRNAARSAPPLRLRVCALREADDRVRRPAVRSGERRADSRDRGMAGRGGAVGGQGRRCVTRCGSRSRGAAASRRCRGSPRRSRSTCRTCLPKTRRRSGSW